MNSISLIINSKGMNNFCSVEASPHFQSKFISFTTKKYKSYNHKYLLHIHGYRFAVALLSPEAEPKVMHKASHAEQLKLPAVLTLKML